MILDDQSEVTEFLCAPETHGGAKVEVIDTHISRIFLAGDRAFKLKRAVRLPYADFSTPAIRLATCEKEVALNAPTAPRLYLGVRRITRAGGGLAFDGAGALVDAVVEMVRFDQEAVLDRVAERGALTEDHIVALARAIVSFHAGAPVVRAPGGAENMAAVLDINAAGFATSGVFSRAEIAGLDARFRRALARQAGWLDRRARAGFVRRCHGDLHLRNICLFEGRPQLFDCIDFNDAIATVDVLYDLAFLLMDLWHRGLTGFANLLANRYFDETGTEDGFGLLPFFMAVRAAVRAHVTATASESAGAEGARLAGMARDYFDLAAALLLPVRPRVVALGGLSGSGKTALAGVLAPHLAPPPGARLLESDRIRKAMFGVSEATPLPGTAYAGEVSERVYRRLADLARGHARGGAPVVLGAVFDRPERRAALDAALAAEGLRQARFWLSVAPDTLRARLGSRPASASDADIAVLEAQLARDPGPIRWTPIDANGTLEDTALLVLHHLGADGPRRS